MRVKRVLFGFLCLVFVFLCTGCMSKKAITTDEFISKAQAQGYSIVDVTSQFASYGIVEEATVAHNSEKYQIEFYVLKNEAEAISMYNTNKSTFETYEGSSSSKTNLDMKNYSSYSLTSSGYYLYLCRVDNTLIYVKTDAVYKESVKSLIKELGY